MRINIFTKTFLALLISFSLVFLFSMQISYNRFGPMYIEENINAVKNTILEEADNIENSSNLADTELYNLSSETSFIRYQNDQIIEQIGPQFLEEDEVIDFVIDVLDDDEATTDGRLIYYQTKTDDIYEINYIYEFDEFTDYLIVSTKIQSLQNVELVLNNLNITQSISVFITIFIISIILSLSISRPIKKINTYAKDISNLQFDSELNIKRRDEFKDLTTSLNEMTFNLKNTYKQLNEANDKLNNDIEFEKRQEEKKKQLIHTINHELKTPLAVMKGMIEGMIDNVGRYKNKEHYLSELLKQIDKIENITKDLTYSLRLEDKITEGEFTNTKDLNFEALVELAKQKQIKLSKSIIPKNLLINNELLKIAIDNIVKNAIIYSTDNSVKISTEVYNDKYVFTVKNKGHINEEDLDKIFDSFYRSDNLNMSKSGNGLGLNIVKQICQLYGYEYKIFNDNKEVVAKIIFNIKV